MASAVFRSVIPAIALSFALIATPASAQFKREGYAFLEAVKDRDGNAVTEALKKPGSVVVNTRDITTGETGLHIVTKREDVTWIKFLTQNGANPNLKDNQGIAPLQIAATLGSVPAVEELLKAGANVDEPNDTGETALISAVHNRNTGMIRVLLANGANPDHNDNSGRSARDYADLMINNGQVLTEFRRADEEREGKQKPQTYGPTF
ncbi:ankyrin repeat domain-containing protein [Pontixanthobacter aestiaquae]|nr:ankyrin repeat domain-containing protein [Pontixanthobacter aestiaquae]MDN3646235.1 ankyrin repeat domain-containing protein [Pontixanthobacter aestiaquae]